MKYLIIVLIMLLSINSYALMLRYEFNSQKYTLKTETMDKCKAIEEGALKCMEYFNANPENEQEYKDLIDICVNPH